MTNKLIYDVGAHKGEDTEFYLKKGFAVLAIEAAPDLCELLKQRFGKFVQEGQLKILNVAVSNAVGPVDFYIDEASVFNTTNLDWVERNKFLGWGKTRKITIEARSLKHIIDEYGLPWYCKIDIEGNDLDALKSLVGSPELPPYISIESEKRNWDRLMDEFMTFRTLGYSRYKIVDQALVPFQTPPRPTREGNDCDHIFERGSSGLFGDDLPGRWLAWPEAIEAYRNIFLGYALNGDNGLFKGRHNIFRALAKLQAKIVKIKERHTGYVSPAWILPWVSWYDTHAAR